MAELNIYNILDYSINHSKAKKKQKDNKKVRMKKWKWKAEIKKKLNEEDYNTHKM